MTKTYKNKRDQFKAELQKSEEERLRLESEIAKLTKKPELSKGLSCTVYCSNCQTVGDVIVPLGVTIHGSGCAYCGCKDTGYLVRTIKQ